MPREAEIRKKAVGILEEEKWVYWYPPKVRFKQNDIFGVFDMVCCQKKTGNLKFIQLTTVSNLSTRRKKIQNFFKENKVNSKKSFSAGIEIWAWAKKKREFKVEII